MTGTDRPLETESLRRRELDFFTRYRVFEAALLAFVAFSPFGVSLAQLHEPIIARTGSILYLIASGVLLLTSRHADMRIRRQAAIGMCVDIVAASTAMLSQIGGESGIALLLLFNVASCGLILSARASLGFAVAAALALLGEYLFNQLVVKDMSRPFAETLMFMVSYLATVLFCQLLGRQMTASHALAEQRGEELANLAEVNELVIRRMRTGVLVVDGSHKVRLSNEAAWSLLGNPSPERRELSDIAPALHKSLWQWRQGRGEVPKSLTFTEGGPDVLPRFVPISLSDSLFLVFLEDSRIYSGRAEELTLSTLGRLSASIAHEIRNPLAAISYSAQLLEEADYLPDADRRLLEIILTQCTRMNGIVENILGLARRERSQPEVIDLASFALKYVDEYRNSHPLETDILQAVCQQRPLLAMADPQQLHQVLTVLVHNALTYGRLPGQPASVTVAVGKDAATSQPLIEVIDHGPGIPTAVVEHIFTPFYTTSPHGTGLGLYIARQLCEANQSSLEFMPVAGGGSCFRIRLMAGQPLLRADPA